MYRIISGKLKGRKIVAPKSFDVRPTTDFAKEALFNIIENNFDIGDLSVLDLFCGIGSISLEFASRGSKDITVIDKNFKHCNFIESMSQKLDVKEYIKIFCFDAWEWLGRKNHHKKKYDLVFADPPFSFSSDEYRLLIDNVRENILHEESVFILEHCSKTKIEHQNLFDLRKYGNVSFSFFKQQRLEA